MTKNLSFLKQFYIIIIIKKLSVMWSRHSILKFAFFLIIEKFGYLDIFILIDNCYSLCDYML